MIKRTLFLFAILAMVATTTNAQKLMLGPQLGYFAPAEEGADGSLLFGGAARVKFGALAVEGAINYRQETQDFLGTDIKTTFFPVLVSGLLYPLPIVYATAGIGWYNISVEIADFNETASEIGYHIGAGAEIPLGNMILSADLKYIFLKYQFEESSSSDYNADGVLINATLFFPL